METASKRIVFTDRIRLIPFSDLHLGSSASHEGKFKDLVKWILSKPDCYAIGLGDYADLITRQDAKRFCGTSVKREILEHIDSLLNEQRDLVVKHLKPLADAGRLLGLVRGNHEDTIHKHYSYDLMRDVCKELNVFNLGYSCFYRLHLKKKTLGVKRDIVMYCHHGFGSSRMSGAAMNKREALFARFDADIILMGHDHHKFGKRSIRIGIDGAGRIVHKPVIIAATGSFLKTLVQGDTTYSEKFGYPPNDIGVVRIDIRFTGKNKVVDIHVSE